VVNNHENKKSVFLLIVTVLKGFLKHLEQGNFVCQMWGPAASPLAGPRVYANAETALVLLSA
jgi:hypothetical protein